MKEYNQTLIAPNACTVVACLTTLSNQTGVTLSLDQIQECYKHIDRTYGKGWLPLATVKWVLWWWNMKFWTRLVYKQIEFWSREFMDSILKWFVYVWFRYTRDYIIDLMDNWVIEKVPTDKQEGWHSVTMTRGLVVIDNYAWRPYNIYKIKNLNVARKIFRWACYIFK